MASEAGPKPGESQLGSATVKKYEAALLLLDELPGYPPLGKRFKKAGREKMEAAALSGSAAAKEHVKRGF